MFSKNLNFINNRVLNGYLISTQLPQVTQIMIPSKNLSTQQRAQIIQKNTFDIK